MHTQSPLRTAFPIIILPQLVLVGTIVLVLLQLVFMVWEIVLVIGAWRYLCIELFGRGTGSLGCMVKLQQSFLCLGYFVTGRYGTAIQDTANLAELAHSRIKVIYLPSGVGCFGFLGVSVGPSLEAWWHHRSQW